MFLSLRSDGIFLGKGEIGRKFSQLSCDIDDKVHVTFRYQRFSEYTGLTFLVFFFSLHEPERNRLEAIGYCYGLTLIILLQPLS